MLPRCFQILEACSFRQYIPSQLNKYDIKLSAFVNSKMTYTFKMEAYAGKQSDGSFRVSNKPVDVVKIMAALLFGSGHNITADNWVTDFNLIHESKKNKLSYVGTVRK